MFSFYPFIVCLALLISLTVIYVKVHHACAETLQELEHYRETKDEYHALMDYFIWKASHGQIAGNVSLNGEDYFSKKTILPTQSPAEELLFGNNRKMIVKNKGFRGNGFLTITLCGKRVCVVIKNGFTFRPIHA